MDSPLLVAVGGAAAAALSLADALGRAGYRGARRAVRSAVRRTLRAVQTAAVVCRLAARLGALVGLHSWRWALFAARLVLFGALLLPAWVVLAPWYARSPRIARGVPYGPHRRNDADVYAPPPGVVLCTCDTGGGGGGGGGRGCTCDPARRPVLVCFAGGAWTIGHRLWTLAMCRALAAAGVVAVSADYRNYPQQTLSGMVEDVDAALEAVLRGGGAGGGGRAAGSGAGGSGSPLSDAGEGGRTAPGAADGAALHAAVLAAGGDPSRVFGWGQSAGAHLLVAAVLERGICATLRSQLAAGEGAGAASAPRQRQQGSPPPPASAASGGASASPSRVVRVRLARARTATAGSLADGAHHDAAADEHDDDDGSQWDDAYGPVGRRVLGLRSDRSCSDGRPRGDPAERSPAAATTTTTAAAAGAGAAALGRRRPRRLSQLDGGGAHHVAAFPRAGRLAYAAQPEPAAPPGLREEGGWLTDGGAGGEGEGPGARELRRVFAVSGPHDLAQQGASISAKAGFTPSFFATLYEGDPARFSPPWWLARCVEAWRAGSGGGGGGGGAGATPTPAPPADFPPLDPATLPPMSLFHGTADSTVPAGVSAALHAALAGAGRPDACLALLPGWGHTGPILEGPLGGRDPLLGGMLAAMRADLRGQPPPPVPPPPPPLTVWEGGGRGAAWWPRGALVPPALAAMAAWVNPF